MGPQNIAPAENLIKNDEVVLFICDGNITHTGMYPKTNTMTIGSHAGLAFLILVTVMSCLVSFNLLLEKFDAKLALKDAIITSMTDELVSKDGRHHYINDRRVTVEECHGR